MIIICPCFFFVSLRDILWYLDEGRASGIRAFFKRSKYSLLSNKHSPAQTTQRESIATYHDDHDDADCFCGGCPKYVRLYFFFYLSSTVVFIWRFCCLIFSEFLVVLSILLVFAVFIVAYQFLFHLNLSLKKVKLFTKFLFILLINPVFICVFSLDKGINCLKSVPQNVDIYGDWNVDIQGLFWPSHWSEQRKNATHFLVVCHLTQLAFLRT